MGGQGKGQVVGYVRVSTVSQREDRQIAALGELDKLFVDHASGSVRDRPQLKAAMSYLREGDVLRITSVDRLARSTTDLLEIVEELDAEGVALEVVETPFLNTTTKESRFMLAVLGAFAEMERRAIRERQAEGIALAKKRGVYEKPPKMTEEMIERAKGLVSKGVPKARVARELGVGRTTLHNALEGKGANAKLQE